MTDSTTSERLELRRDVSVWGSFMWGYADVGADIYAALGLVMAAAQGAAGLAFAAAGLVYIMIGLAYTELASAYPMAGGGQYYASRGLGDLWGFVAGSALLLDYTIDIALFATASAGYMNFFLPSLIGRTAESFAVRLGPLPSVNLLWLIEALVLIALLIWLNIRGVRESSLFNEVIGAVDIATESSIIIFGFFFAWKPELLVSQWQHQFPTLKQFMYGSSLAIISFVGLESISQAAQETRRPATVIPRTSLALIFTVFIFATAFSTLGLGVLPWQVFAEHQGDPVAKLASSIPYLGAIAGPFAAILGATILLISANTGVMGSSRLTYSMSQLHLISPWFDKVHAKYRTPIRTIVIFSLVGVLETLLAFLTPAAMDTLGNMYAFGATLGYTLVFVALIRLRFSDPYTPRPYKMPLNVRIHVGGRPVDFPVLGVLGMLGVSTILFEVILTHEIGRVAGPAWVLACFGYYVWYRRRQGLPVFTSVQHDWERHQMEVLASAEEFDLLEQYRLALEERDRRERRLPPEKPAPRTTPAPPEALFPPAPPRPVVAAEARIGWEDPPKALPVVAELRLNLRGWLRLLCALHGPEATPAIQAMKERIVRLARERGYPEWPALRDYLLSGGRVNGEADKHIGWLVEHFRPEELLPELCGGARRP